MELRDISNTVAVITGASIGIGQAAARALVKHSDLSATEIARESMKIASEICIYTNDHITLEEIDLGAENPKEAGKKKDKGVFEKR